MPPFDIPAFTRGISGGITGGLEGKREAEDRAEERRQRVIAEGISERQVAEREAAGKARRARDAAAAEERRLKREELEAGQRQRADFILNQLGAEDLEGIKGFEGQTLADQLKSLETALRRKRTKADRVPRAGPKPFAQDARVRRVVNLYSQLADEGLNPKDDLLARIRAGGDVDTPVPVDSARVRQQAMLEATNRFRHEFTEGELPDLTTILDGIVNEKQEKPEPSVADIEQMIRDLHAQGLSPEEIQANLAQQGINVRL